MKHHNPDIDSNVISIGTGGNINKLFRLARKSGNLSMSLSELRALRAYVNAFSFEERQTILKLNPDRADVIVPASEIYIKVMQAIGSDEILVPKVGLKDGLLFQLYESVKKTDIANFEYIEQF